MGTFVIPATNFTIPGLLGSSPTMKNEREVQKLASRKLFITTDPRTHYLATSRWVRPDYRYKFAKKIPLRCKLFKHRWENPSKQYDCKDVYGHPRKCITWTCSRCGSEMTKLRGYFVEKSFVERLYDTT